MKPETKCINPGCENIARTRKGFCSQKCWGSFHFKLRNAAQKGKTQSEILGEEKAKIVIAKRGASIKLVDARTGYLKKNLESVHRFRRGKTFDEIYGKKKSSMMKRSIRNHFLGKSYVELYGLELAKIRVAKMSASLKLKCATPEYSKVLAENRKKGIEKFQSMYIKHNAPFMLKGWYKRGEHNGVRFDSSYEEKFLEFMDIAAGYDIKRYPGSLVYIFRSREYKLFPDFALYRDGKMIAILEVKGEHYLNNARTYAKLKCIQDYCDSLGIIAGLFSRSFRKDFFYGNPDPSQRNSLFVRVQAMQRYLTEYLVRWKEQRLIIEDNESNKMIKIDNIGYIVSPNSAHPDKDDDIVRYPSKGGCHV